MKQVLRHLVSISVLAAFAWHALAHPGSGIVVDRKGQVFFSDTGQGVWKIDRAGKLVFFHKSAFHWMAIDQEGSFTRSRSLSTGRRDAAFERITAEGGKPALITSSDYPITVGRDRNLYYAPYRREGPMQIVRQTPEGNTSVLATINADTEGDRIQWVNGIATGPDGSIYFSENSAVRKITMQGDVWVLASRIQVPGCSTDRVPEMPPGPYLRGLAVDSRGVVYVAANGCRSLLKITPRGEVSVVLQAPSPWSPTGVAFHRGQIYVLEYDHTPVKERQWPPRVRKIASNGKVTTLATVERKQK